MGALKGAGALSTKLPQEKKGYGNVRQLSSTPCWIKISMETLPR
jgi:hypothetical protein